MEQSARAALVPALLLQVLDGGLDALSCLVALEEGPEHLGCGGEQCVVVPGPVAQAGGIAEADDPAPRIVDEDGQGKLGDDIGVVVGLAERPVEISDLKAM